MAKKWFIAGKNASVASEETFATAEEAEKALETGKYKLWIVDPDTGSLEVTSFDE